MKLINRVVILKIILFSLCSGQEFLLQTDQAGFRTVTNTNGLAVADYDLDGDLDVYFVGKSSYNPADMRTWNRLFSNQGDGSFDDVTAGSGLLVMDNDTLSNTGGNGSKLGAFWGDYDNDGHPDLFVTNYGFNQLFHNNGDKTFTDVTAEAGVSGGASYLSTGAVWFDYDLDGDLDLYVCNWKNFNQDRSPQNWMYENNGDGTFEDVSEFSGAADTGKTYTPIAIDANNDRYLDLYLANDFGDNRFYENQGDKSFKEKTEEYNLADGFHGMGLAIGDIDRNGYFDIYLTNATEDQYEEEINALFLNNGDNYFYNNSLSAGIALAGWGWGTEFFDLENDGDEDLFVVTGFYFPDFSNRLFKNNSYEDSLVFKDVTIQAGVDDYEAAHGLAVFDYDDDGDQDLLVSNTNDVPFLYSNQTAQGNWINVSLEGTETNRSAFGSIVEIDYGGNVTKKYHHGVQFQSQSVLPLHFGVGEARVVDKIEVTWLSGNVDIFDSVSINQTVKMTEGVGLISKIDQLESNLRQMPERINLIDNYPNPFNGSTKIRFIINIPGEVELRVYTILGELVYEERRSFLSTGEKTVSWDANNLVDQIVSSGVYLYQLELNNSVSDVGKMFLVK